MYSLHQSTPKISGLLTQLPIFHFHTFYFVSKPMPIERALPDASSKSDYVTYLLYTGSYFSSKMCYDCRNLVLEKKLQCRILLSTSLNPSGMEPWHIVDAHFLSARLPWRMHRAQQRSIIFKPQCRARVPLCSGRGSVDTCILTDLRLLSSKFYIVEFLFGPCQPADICKYPLMPVGPVYGSESSAGPENTVSRVDKFLKVRRSD